MNPTSRTGTKKKAEVSLQNILKCLTGYTLKRMPGFISGGQGGISPLTYVCHPRVLNLILIS